MSAGAVNSPIAGLTSLVPGKSALKKIGSVLKQKTEPSRLFSREDISHDNRRQACP